MFGLSNGVLISSLARTSPEILRIEIRPFFWDILYTYIGLGRSFAAAGKKKCALHNLHRIITAIKETLAFAAAVYQLLHLQYIQ